MGELLFSWRWVRWKGIGEDVIPGSFHQPEHGLGDALADEEVAFAIVLFCFVAIYKTSTKS